MSSDIESPRDPTWLAALRRYLAASLGFHLLWEAAQLPLYAIWTTGTLQEKGFAVVHCTAGDVMIAGFTLIAALLVAGSNDWPSQSAREVLVLTIALGVAYMIYSEWTNTVTRNNWAYSSLMPVLPVTGTGLSPLLQWLVVPPLALGAATRGRWFGSI